MHQVFLRVKGIIKKENQYLVLKRWIDDRIPEPFLWEFVDGEVIADETPDEAVLRHISDNLGIEGTIDKIVYTWSQMLGDVHCVGIAYLCHVEAEDSQFVISEDFGGWEWITKEEFSEYITNENILKDLQGAEF